MKKAILGILLITGLFAEELSLQQELAKISAASGEQQKVMIEAFQKKNKGKKPKTIEMNTIKALGGAKLGGLNSNKLQNIVKTKDVFKEPKLNWN